MIFDSLTILISSNNLLIMGAYEKLLIALSIKFYKTDESNKNILYPII